MVNIFVNGNVRKYILYNNMKIDKIANITHIIVLLIVFFCLLISTFKIFKSTKFGGIIWIPFCIVIFLLTVIL